MAKVKHKPAKSQAAAANKRDVRDPTATRAALIAAACVIFKTAGYFATDTNAIARAAGYAPGTFYTHFADKTEIMLAVLDRYSEIEWGAIAKASTRGDRRARVRAILRVVTKLHAEWAVFRADLRVLEGREPSVSMALQSRLTAQIKAIAALTGLDPVRNAATAVLIRTIVQRLSEAIDDGRALGVSREAILHSAEAAILALIERDEAAAHRAKPKARPS